MKNGSVMNYKFGPKNNWRRTAWNRIVERLTVPVEDAVVLYLAGEMDLDRKEALARGFKASNLIAVDRDSEIVSKLRKDKSLAVNGDIFEVLKAWSGTPINVLILDLCCGATEQVMANLVQFLIHGCLQSCVILFNLMRGRDRLDLDLSEHLKKGKHRGEFVYAHALHQSAMNLLFNFAHTSGGTWEEFQAWCYHFRSPESLNPDIRLAMRNWIPILNAASKPWFNSYRSTSGQFFDSAIWINPTLEYLKRLGLISFQEALHPDLVHDRDIRRSISAIRAVRTRMAA